MTRGERDTNRYRQVRLTYTEEIGGRISYRISVKPLNKQWNEGHVIVQDSLTGFGPAESVEAVFERLERICAEQFLPRDV